VANFPHFNGTGAVYTFVSVNRRNNEARAHVAITPAIAVGFDTVGVERK